MIFTPQLSTTAAFIYIYIYIYIHSSFLTSEFLCSYLIYHFNSTSMSAMNLPPPEDISHSRALGGDGNSNLFSPLTLISLAARLCSVSPTPTLPSLPSSLFRVSDRNKGQGLSINELHRAYCGDNNSHQLPKEGLFEEGSTWARLEIPDTVSAASNDIEGGLMMGPPNESMFAIFSPGPVKAEKKKEKEKDDIEEGGGMMGPPSDSMFPAYSPGPVKEEKQYQVGHSIYDLELLNIIPFLILLVMRIFFFNSLWVGDGISGLFKFSI